MQVFWDSRVGGPPRMASGQTPKKAQHRRGTPRVWTIELMVWSETEKEKILIRPRGKMTMFDIQTIVDEHIAQFVSESGEVTRSYWSASAR